MINIISIKKGRSGFLPFYMIVFLCLFFLFEAEGQVTPFRKSVLDSLKANEFNLSIALAFNASQDGVSSVAGSTDLGVMYSTSRSSFELLQSSFYSLLGGFTTFDRFAAILKGTIFSHEIVDGYAREKKVYPEPFVSYSEDGNRALNYRWQFGVNGVYAFKPTKVIRMRMGAGLLYEKENWQMITSGILPYIDTFPDAIKHYIFDTIGVTKNGELLRDNFRTNLYANFLCTFTNNISLNAFFDVQVPFKPPYHGLPVENVFPVDTKLYPRILINMQLSFNIWGKLDLITEFLLLADKGQIPTYVPDFAYNLSEGIQIGF